MIVVSKASADRHGIVPQARLMAYATASGDPEQFTLAPIDAINKLLARLSLKLSEIDLFEINEAFAVAPMAVINALDISGEKVNVNGGAIALGHPIGASGSRILVTLIHALAAKSARYGIAVVCIGGGEAIAVAIENLQL
jgi:acetyl-CoA C-acetyltransferase